jgi:hypothetical protein
MMYGSVISVDPEHRILVMRMENRFEVGGQPVLLKLVIPDNALIGRQSLIKSANGGGVYNQLSPIASITLHDIRTGEHIASLTYKYENELKGYVIIVGDPL